MLEVDVSWLLYRADPDRGECCKVPNGSTLSDTRVYGCVMTSQKRRKLVFCGSQMKIDFYPACSSRYP